MIPCGGCTTLMRQLPLFFATTRGRLLIMKRKNKFGVCIEREYLDNIKLSVCGVGLMAHITRWEDDGHHDLRIADQIYEMCSHDQSAAVGYLELLDEKLVINEFTTDELKIIREIAYK